MSDGYHAYAHVEAMGHRSHWGLVSEEQIAGASFLRVDVLKIGAEEPSATFLYPPASIYCLTPCTEDRARLMATPYSERPEAMRELPAAQPWDGMHVATADEDDDDLYDDMEPVR